jgi:hypothetical protein
MSKTLRAVYNWRSRALDGEKSPNLVIDLGQFVSSEPPEDSRDMATINRPQLADERNRWDFEAIRRRRIHVDGVGAAQCAQLAGERDYHDSRRVASRRVGLHDYCWTCPRLKVAGASARSRKLHTHNLTAHRRLDFFV